MEKISTVLVEDEPEAMMVLEGLVAEHSDIQIIAKASNIEDALLVIALKKPDLVFMDILLHGRLAFELLEKLNNENVYPKIIFITAYNNYVRDALQYLLIDYLDKPINREKLNAAIEKFKKFSTKENGEYTEKLKNLPDFMKNKVIFKEEGGFITFDPREVLYLESIKGESYTNIHLEVNEKPHMISQTIGKVAEKFQDDYIYRIDRSKFVNLQYFNALIKPSIIKKSWKYKMLKNGKTHQIDISYEKAVELKKRLDL